MAAKLLLLYRKNCPPCEKAKVMLRGLIDAGEIQVVDLDDEEQAKKLDLAETTPPSVCVYSDQEKRCINDLVLSGGNPKLGRIGLRLAQNWVDKMGE